MNARILFRGRYTTEWEASLLAAFVAPRVIRSLLFAISPTDPVTLTAVPLASLERFVAVL